MKRKIIGPDALDWRQIGIDWDATSQDVIYAGTPMSEDGKIANDGSAYGILLEDVLRKRNKNARVVVAGIIDRDEAEAQSGLALSEDAIAALPNVLFIKGNKNGDYNWKELGLPYSEGGGMVEIFPETTLQYDGGFKITTPPTEGLVVGDRYKVLHNGVEYSATALDGTPYGIPVPFLLNDGADILAGTGIVFLIMLSDSPLAAFGGAYGVVDNGLTGGTLTLSVWHDNETIHKLDNKYLDLEWLPVTKEAKGELIADKFLSSQEPHIFPGRKYLVIYDGVEYECTPVPIGGAAIVMGNLSWAGASSNGEPFYVMDALDSDFANTYNLTVYDVETQKVTDKEYAIYPIEEVPDKMPEKFLPDGVGGVTYVNVSVTNDETSVGDHELTEDALDKSYEEICALIDSGAQVVAKIIADNAGIMPLPLSFHYSGAMTSFTAVQYLSGAPLCTSLVMGSGQIMLSVKALAVEE